MATIGASLPPFAGALAQTAPAAKGPKLLEMDGKAKLVVLGDRPLLAETPAALMDDDVTPTDKLFIRNNGQVPELTRDPKAWRIKVDGEVNTPLEITLGELAGRFPNVTYQLVLECGGNGRSFFEPEARGNQWTNGGAGCPPAYVPPAKPAAVAAAPAFDPDKSKPPHNDKPEDLPDGKGRDVTFHTCTACHGVALIKAQGLTRELWDSTFDLMLQRHRMPPVPPAERAEILDCLTATFPPRRRGRESDNPFLK
jgi:hypothetical protein